MQQNFFSFRIVCGNFIPRHLSQKSNNIFGYFITSRCIHISHSVTKSTVSIFSSSFVAVYACVCICDCVYLCMQCERGGGEERVWRSIPLGVAYVGGGGKGGH